MQSPASKQQLLALVRSAWSTLDAGIAPLSDEQLSRPGVAGNWSVKDILAHVTWWQLRMLLKLNNEGEAFALPGEDHETTIQRINDEVYREHRDQSPAEIKAAFYASFQRVMQGLSGYAEEFLLAHVEDIAADTWDHYAEHAASIRDWVNRQ
jgi:uncharacterized protein (TIGR03083 family)